MCGTVKRFFFKLLKLRDQDFTQDQKIRRSKRAKVDRDYDTLSSQFDKTIMVLRHVPPMEHKK